MSESPSLPVLSLSGSWKDLPHTGLSGELARVLSAYMPGCRWFGSKSREIVFSEVESVHPVGPVRSGGGEVGPFFLCVLLVSYRDGTTERYLFPLGQSASGRLESKARIARIEWRGEGPGNTELVDGLYLPEMGRALLDLFGRSGALSGEQGEGSLGILTAEAFDRLRRSSSPDEEPVLFRGEQSNSSLLFGGSLMLKCFRRLEPGINPDLEVGMFLEEETRSRIIAPLGGAILGKTPAGEPLTFAMLQGFVANRGDGWSWMRDTLKKGVLDSEHGERVSSGPFGEKLSRMVLRIGTRTAELHQSLARDPEDPDFAPVPLTPEDIGELVRSVGARMEKTFALLERNLDRLPPASRPDGETVLERVSELRGLIGLRAQSGILGEGYKIRCHGDFHLGQLLVTPEEDVVFLDFEGEPALPIAERRRKSSPLLDLAGMLRSLHYVSRSVLGNSPDPAETLKSHRWFVESSESYLSAYFRKMESGRDLLPSRGSIFRLLTVYLLRKALYELEYELDNRPDWVGIPLVGILTLLAER